MNPSVWVFYLVACALLFLKTFVVISMQGRARTGTGRFRYAEDAQAFGGEHVAVESEALMRLQRIVDNESETQIYFFVFGGLFIVSGAAPWAAPLYFGVYVGSRIVHAILLARPRQPHRTIAFGIGIVTLLGLAIHTTYGLLR